MKAPRGRFPNGTLRDRHTPHPTFKKNDKICDLEGGSRKFLFRVPKHVVKGAEPPPILREQGAYRSGARVGDRRRIEEKTAAAAIFALFPPGWGIFGPGGGLGVDRY